MSDHSDPSVQSDWRAAFLAGHELPGSYRDYAQQWFDPLAGALSVRQSGAPEPLLVGVNGSQGSGKTTMVAYLVEALRQDYGLFAVGLSLDDFYLSKSQREELARSVHPLLRTRGVPGTHDLPLLLATLRQLADPSLDAVDLPGFDKSTDDRLLTGQWRTVSSTPDVILLEGWCLGALPQSEDALIDPVNELERTEDREGAWRRYVNEALHHYLELYERIAYWVMLAAPSFACVLDWRQQQERKLARHKPDAPGIMSAVQLERFVQHYQRLTDHCLQQLPERVDYLLELDDRRQVQRCLPGT